MVGKKKTLKEKFEEHRANFCGYNHIHINDALAYTIEWLQDHIKENDTSHFECNCPICTHLKIATAQLQELIKDVGKTD